MSPVTATENTWPAMMSVMFDSLPRPRNDAMSKTTATMLKHPRTETRHLPYSNHIHCNGLRAET